MGPPIKHSDPQSIHLGTVTSLSLGILASQSHLGVDFCPGCKPAHLTSICASCSYSSQRALASEPAIASASKASKASIAGRYGFQRYSHHFALAS